MYWHNYFWESGNKVSCVALESVDLIFVTNKIAFEKQFLFHHEHLHFRAQMSSAAVIYTIQKQYQALNEKFPYNIDYFATIYRDARFLMLTMREIGHETIVIGSEISDEALIRFDEKTHQADFPPNDFLSVTEISGDGH